MSITSNRRRSE